MPKVSITPVDEFLNEFVGTVVSLEPEGTTIRQGNWESLTVVCNDGSIKNVTPETAYVVAVADVESVYRIPDGEKDMVYLTDELRVALIVLLSTMNFREAIDSEALALWANAVQHSPVFAIEFHGVYDRFLLELAEEKDKDNNQND